MSFDARWREDEPDLLAEVVDQLTEQFAQGEPCDLEALCRQHPQLAPRLRRLVPAIAAVSDLRNCPEDSATEGLPIPETLGGFRILRQLGRGGMGVVYLAEQIGLGRRVAVKVLPFATLLDQRQLERFRNEARAAAMLRHPAIVGVHAVGCEHGINYYVMDYVEGLSLAEIIAQNDAGRRPASRPFSRPDRDNSGGSANSTAPLATLSTARQSGQRGWANAVANIGIQAARALHHAHQQGVLHRDIKPSNLLVDQDGNLHITDFGLARIQEDQRLTVTGDLVGTLRYMSPEQLTGEMLVDQRTDICALGLTLYELLTGQAAYPAQQRAVLMEEVRRGVPAPPTRVCPDIPRDLETIVLKAIEKVPALRYQQAAALADDLERYLQNKPVRARRIGTWERLRRWAVRNPLLATLLITVSMLLTMLAVGSTAVAYRFATSARRQRSQIYARDIRLAQRAVEEGRMLDAEANLLRWVGPARGPDLRGLEWFYLWGACHDPAIERTIAHEVATHAVRFVESDDKLAVGWFSDRVTIWDLTRPTGSGPVRELPMDCQYVGSLIGGPPPARNRLWAGGVGGNLVAWDTPSATPVRRYPMDLPKMASACFSVHTDPRNRWLAIGAGGYHAGAVRVFDRTDGSLLTSLEGFPGRCQVSFTPTGRLLVTSKNDDRLRWYDPASGQVVTVHQLNADSATELAHHPDGRHVAIGTLTQRGMQPSAGIEFWDLVDGVRVARTTLTAAEIRSLDYSPDGSLLAAGDESGQLFLLDSDHQVIASRRAHGGTVKGLAFSSQGNKLATASDDKTVHVWSVARLLDGAAHQVKLERPLVFCQNSVFLDEQTLCSSSGTGELVLWNAATGKVKDVWHLRAGTANALRVAVSADRRRIGIVCGEYPHSANPGRLLVLDASTGRELRAVDVPPVASGGVAFAPDGRRLAAVLAEQIVLWDFLAPGDATDAIHTLSFDAPPKCLDFSADGRWLACGDVQGQVSIYRAKTLEPFLTFQGDSQIAMRTVFSPDSSLLAVVGFDRVIKLFETDRFQELPNPGFLKVAGYQNDLCFSPDGTRLLTAGPDGRAHLWDRDSGEELLTFHVADAWYPAITFSPQGNSLAISVGCDVFALQGADRRHLSPLSVEQLGDIVCQRMDQIRLFRHRPPADSQP